MKSNPRSFFSLSVCFLIVVAICRGQAPLSSIDQPVDLATLTAQPVASTPPHGQKFVSAANRAFYYSGRFDFSRSAEPVAIWQSSQIGIDFEGSALTLLFARAEGQNFFDARVDDQKQVIAIVAPEPTELIWPSPLGNGWHHLTLYKRSEASAGTVAFRGIELNPGSEVRKSEGLEKATRLLFFGDSITAGACNEDGAVDQWATRRTHNAALSYAALTANAFNAECRNISVSGIGIVLGYGDVTFGEIWDRLYPKLKSPKDDLTKWQPNVVFFNFGENDASFSHGHGLPFPRLFIQHYVELVQAARHAFPRAELVLLRGGMSGGATDPRLIAAWTEVVKKVEAEDKRASHFVFTHWSVLHPRVADDRKMADELIAWLRAQTFMGIDGPK